MSATLPDLCRLALEAAEAVRAYRLAVSGPGWSGAASIERYEEARAAVQYLAAYLEIDGDRPEKAAHLYAETAQMAEGSCELHGLERWCRSLADAEPVTEPPQADGPDPRAALEHCDRCEGLRPNVVEVVDVAGPGFTIDLCGECRATVPGVSP